MAYTVQPGDTLFSLGRSTGASVQEIQAANCLNDTTLYAGQPLYLPGVPIAASTPTDTTPTPSPLPTVDPSAVWAPNGKRYATHLGTVVDVERGWVIEAARIPWVKFWNWTPDSRYAIFGRRNQYGDASTHIFDTQDWKPVYNTPDCPRSPCGEFPLLLSPAGTRLVTENGMLIDFNGTPQTDLVVGSEFLKLKTVQWSDDGAYLVYVS